MEQTKLEEHLKSFPKKCSPQLQKVFDKNKEAWKELEAQLKTVPCSAKGKQPDGK